MNGLRSMHLNLLFLYGKAGTMKSSNIGGQAVLEGIMMKNGKDYAVAVRKPDKEIEVKKDEYRSFISGKSSLRFRLSEEFLIL